MSLAVQLTVVLAHRLKGSSNVEDFRIYTHAKGSLLAFSESPITLKTATACSDFEKRVS